jgi:hypothetical protein
MRMIMVNLITELKLNLRSLRQHGTRTVPRPCLPPSQDASLRLQRPISAVFRGIYTSRQIMFVTQNSCHLPEKEFFQAFWSRQKISRRGFSLGGGGQSGQNMLEPGS